MKSSPGRGPPGTVLGDWDGRGGRCGRGARDAGAGDILLVMSNGSFGGIHEKLLAALGRVTAQGGTPSGSDRQGFSQ